jgi:hypothetical protein
MSTLLLDLFLVGTLLLPLLALLYLCLPIIKDGTV